jgi:uncharacterized protein (TIGR03435 family)
MAKTLTFVALLALSLDHAHGQEIPNAPAFEVASITPCKPGTPAPPGEHAGMVQFTYPGGRFRASATTLQFLVEWAYDIQPFQHSNGPSWLGTDRYDIVAKAENNNATDDEIKLMMQTLLADRFHLMVHHERKEAPVYIISVGESAPKLFPPKEGETHAIRITPQMGPDQKIASYHVAATRFSLTQLTDTFARQLGRVIVNQTGLSGDFDFTLDLTMDEGRPNPLDPSLLISAMRGQLGLALKAQKAAVDYLVIDSAEKVVAEN